MDSVTWTLCGAELNLCWVIRDLEPEDQSAANGGHRRDKRGKVVVCNPERRDSSITLYYPEQFSPFFGDEGLHKALEPGNFLNKVRVCLCVCVSVRARMCVCVRARLEVWVCVLICLSSCGKGLHKELD
jgi:hypothetical protein